MLNDYFLDGKRVLFDFKLCHVLVILLWIINEKYKVNHVPTGKTDTYWYIFAITHYFQQIQWSLSRVLYKHLKSPETTWNNIIYRRLIGLL